MYLNLVNLNTIKGTKLKKYARLKLISCLKLPTRRLISIQFVVRNMMVVLVSTQFYMRSHFFEDIPLFIRDMYSGNCKRTLARHIHWWECPGFSLAA